MFVFCNEVPKVFMLNEFLKATFIILPKKKLRFTQMNKNSGPSVDVNSKNCKCSYTSCEKKGKCCECLIYHLTKNELPGCVFPSEIEKTYDWSIGRFVKFHSGQG